MHHHNKERKLVSVILLTYNHQDLIAKAIESILEQETTFDFTIQIFEDCSTDDNTAAICKKYAENYPEKIELILRKKNIGAARNVMDAVRQIETKYWAYLEGDDYWCDKNKLQLAVDILESHPQLSMTGHNTKIYDFKTKKEFLMVNNGTFSNGVNKPGDNIFSFENCPYLHVSSRVHRTAAVDFKKETLFMSSDLNWLYKFLSEGNMYYIDKVMSVYNLTGVGSYSGTSPEKRELQNFNLMYKLNKYFNYKYDNFYVKNIKNFVLSDKLSFVARKIYSRLFNCIEKDARGHKAFYWFLLYLLVNLRYKLFKFDQTPPK